MSTYARIHGGIVAELFTPPVGVTITECFHPELEWVERTTLDVAPGWTYAGGVFSAPAAPVPPTLAQQASAILAGGIQITSSTAPSLDGTYACDPTTYQRMGGIVAALAGGLGLPGGGATFNWPDASGTPHAFTADQFKSLCGAVMDFDYALNTIIGSNSGTLPTLPISIA